MMERPNTLQFIQLFPICVWDEFFFRR
jgi:hypothetical protein